MYYVATNDNTKIAVYDIAPYNKETVVFIHGWPLDSRIFEYQTNILPSYGYRCILIDLRGFGNSDRPYDGYDYNTLADDLYAVMNSVDCDNVTLVGFSMGGAIASRYMSRYKGYKVKKLALLGAAVPSFTSYPGFPYGTDTLEVDDIILNMYKDRPKTVVDFGKNFYFSDISEEFRECFNSIATSEGSYSTIKTAISLRDENLVNDLISIKVPTGIFHGVQDKICPYELAIESHKIIDNSKLFPFFKSGHAVYYDELEVFNKVFLEFLSI